MVEAITRRVALSYLLKSETGKRSEKKDLEEMCDEIIDFYKK